MTLAIIFVGIQMCLLFNLKLISGFKYGDNCKDVYIDLGCNSGVQIRKLYEHSRFDLNISTMLQLFDTHFGVGVNRKSVCSFCFEPNPLHRLKLQEMEAVYATHDIRFTHFEYAVSTKNTTLKLFRQNNHYDFAALLIKDSTQFPSKQIDSHTVDVNVINFIEFLQVHIVNRKLPDGETTGNSEYICVNMYYLNTLYT